MGIDISRQLIDAARRLAKETAAMNVNFEAADAQTHQFAVASLDVVFSRFGVMFFDDPEAAFRNFHSALRPDMLDSLDGPTQSAIAGDIRNALTRFETAGHVALDATAWLVTARATV
jgi:ubiquinone/menaquinone biosynthesis C-methylase UbiE